VPVLVYIIVAVAAYLLGSIPTGFLVAKIKGIDIRSVGSGNIGATNAMRVLGKPAGIFVLLMDAAKGFLAVYLAIMMARRFYWNDPELQTLQVIAGVGAVLGHNYTCWLKFKGGKGIATTAGVYLALAPWPLLVAFVVFILAVLFTRYISVGSISAAVALPFAVLIMQPKDLLLGIVTVVLGALAIYKHKSNIKRLMAGTENRLGKKREATK
jgi:glycerol-3-phosphate acyltransferase PlsY